MEENLLEDLMEGRTIKDIQKDIELLGIHGGYDVEQLLTPLDCRRLSARIDELEQELKEEREQREYYQAIVESWE